MSYVFIRALLLISSVYSYIVPDSVFKYRVSPCYTHPKSEERVEAIDERLLSNLKKIGINEFNETQREAIPKIMEDSSRNICILSQTGTGKTVSYLVPIIQSLLRSSEKQANTLIIVPNSILIYQVHDVIKNLVEGMPIKSKTVDDIETGDLPHVVVSSPLKLLNKFKTYNLNYKVDAFQRVRTLVLDEVDQLLVHKETLPPVCDNVHLTYTHKQPLTQIRKKTILCSSTLSSAGRRSDSKLVSQLFQNCTYVKSETLHKIPPSISINFVHYKDERERFDKLVEYLNNNKHRTLIYCNNSTAVERLYSKLIKHGKNVHILNKNVELIEQIMIATSQDKKLVVVSTDLSSRGVDFKHFKSVVHYDFPTNVIKFIHR
ncbi:DEAD-box family RNA helicase [Theileria orientalis strain Shintoku]|uniref:ATP-dependent RNA helicase n=1 Tax=Theileria orientalis strain Shintoku TaxID=869250 RepID=J4C2W7_THEOR|nr:DEAD-box family RNA helicase [Theileria orientalis strain Shintoku]BAM39411.1 DEAD-box family RNA helicase [Theileria orientalis strain Shintoku]|eukprot:XP_009689712.1 DEAD-box family RNA helicase [Theileria orientalis strain Shintoku]